MARRLSSALDVAALVLALAGAACDPDPAVPVYSGQMTGDSGTGTPDAGVQPGGTGNSGTIGSIGGTGQPGAAGGPGGSGNPGGLGGPGGPDSSGALVDGAVSTKDGGAGSGTSDGSVIGGGGDASSFGDGGACCAGGDCLCHTPPPATLSAAPGPFKTESMSLSTGTAYYPVDAEPPFAAVAIIPGFLNIGPEIEAWGPFYASWGIVCVITSSGPVDIPEFRAVWLADAITELKAENTKDGSPLKGKLSDRFGTSGFSMGGGATSHASAADPTLKTSVGLAPWFPIGEGLTVPTLHLCGSSDGVAPCSHAQDAYDQIPNTTPKMLITITGAGHLDAWFGPADGGNGTSGGYALAFQKVFLEGDERWRSTLLTKPQGHELITNIK